MSQENKKIKIGVIGASGYTGADLIRLALRHPNISITALFAKTHAGKPIEEVFPHLGGFGLPDLEDTEGTDWGKLDAVFCGLPHGTAHQIIQTLPDSVKVIDMSADFRLRDTETYATWYGLKHEAGDLLKKAVYGLSEYYRDDIKNARLVACPGCYPTATLMALLPVSRAGLVDIHDLVIDAKSGVSGAGRGLKMNTLFSECGEGLSPYAVGKHRHAPEIEQEIGVVTNSEVIVNFTPHLVPMSRGELVTCYVRMQKDTDIQALHSCLAERYQNEAFIDVLPIGTMPGTQHVRGSNRCLISVLEDRIRGRAIIVSTLDNLVKGSAGQALQNFNLMFNLEETTGLTQIALFP